MTLKDLCDVMVSKLIMNIELRNNDNKTICTFTNDSDGAKPYEHCEVLGWFSVRDNGRVIIQIDTEKTVNGNDLEDISASDILASVGEHVDINEGLPKTMLFGDSLCKKFKDNLNRRFGIYGLTVPKELLEFDIHHRIYIIADHYGYSYISRLLVEEMAELTQALNKYYRYGDEHDGKSTIDGILEEIADVEICLEELKWLIAEHWGGVNTPALTNLKDLNDAVLYNIKVKKIKREEARMKK